MNRTDTTIALLIVWILALFACWRAAPQETALLATVIACGTMEALAVVGGRKRAPTANMNPIPAAALLLATSTATFAIAGAPAIATGVRAAGFLLTMAMIGAASTPPKSKP